MNKTCFVDCLGSLVETERLVSPESMEVIRIC